MKLAPNFTLYELIRSRTADDLGIDNQPDSEALINLVYLAQTLQEIRFIADAPIKITSGYRCPALNKAVGGVGDSRHQSGLAADFIAKGWDNRRLTRLIRDSGIAYEQLILEFPENGGWIHIAIHPLGAEGEHSNLLAQRINGKTSYSPLA